MSNAPPPSSFAPPPTSLAPPPRRPSLLLPLLGAAAAALVVGGVIGFFGGRMVLERQWAQSSLVVSAADVKRASANDADPTPQTGTHVLRPMPIGRARVAVREMTSKDAVVASVVSFGAGNDGFELHVVVENHGKCTLKSVSGVAYGFGALGRPGAANKNGEGYVAFTSDVSIAPGAKHALSQKLHYADAVTLGVAHIDSTTCTDGTSWKRA